MSSIQLARELYDLASCCVGNRTLDSAPTHTTLRQSARWVGEQKPPVSIKHLQYRVYLDDAPWKSITRSVGERRSTVGVSYTFKAETSKDTVRFVFPPGESTPLDAAFRALMDSSPAHRLEAALRKEARKASVPPMSADFWDAWQSRLPQTGESCGEVYETSIYPDFLKMLRCLKFANQTILQVHDVPCGRAGMWSYLSQWQEGLNKEVAYYGVDSNDTQCRAARRVVGQTHRVEHLSFDDYFAKTASNSCDLLISCGGMFNLEVGESHEKALHYLKETHRVLRPGGYLLMGGLTQLFINIHDVEKFNAAQHSTFRLLCGGPLMVLRRV